MTEKIEGGEVDWNSASYNDFLKRQEEIRQGFGSTTPLIKADNFPELMEKRKLFRDAGFDANEHTRGGVSIFIENEEQYKKLQEVATEKGWKIDMETPRKG